MASKLSTVTERQRHHFMKSTNAIKILCEDHQDIIKTMEDIAITVTWPNAFDTHTELKSLFEKFKQQFNAHDAAEEKIVYPELERIPQLTQKILKCHQAHHMAEVGILELKLLPFSSESWGPKFLIIRDAILSHIKEEETEIFPVAEEILSQRELGELGKMIHEQRD